MSRTKFTKSGQPAMGTTMEAHLDTRDENGAIISTAWEPVEIVGKLYGRGGNADLVAVLIGFDDGSSMRVPWPCADLRPSDV